MLQIKFRFFFIFVSLILLIQTYNYNCSAATSSCRWLLAFKLVFVVADIFVIFSYFFLVTTIITRRLILWLSVILIHDHKLIMLQLKEPSAFFFLQLFKKKARDQNQKRGKILNA